MRLNGLYEYVEQKIGGAFAKYGRFVAAHAWKIIIVTIIVNGALGIGMMRLKSNIEADNVYLPQGMFIKKHTALHCFTIYLYIKVTVKSEWTSAKCEEF